MATSLFDLSGQVALVTGASSGLGLAIAEAFCAQGAAVVLAGLDGPGCEAAAARLRAAGHDASAHTCDVSRTAELQALAAAVLAERGRIDTLVCNAGVQGPAGPLAQVGEADWAQVMAVNLQGALTLCNLVIPQMAQRGAGSVVLMASIAAVRGNKAIGLYGISKAGLAQLARNLAVEWGPQGVRANSISPGLIETPFAQTLIGNEAFMARRLQQTPLRRVGQPHEIAGTAVFLASAAGAFVTGQNLVVDGGTTISDGN
jgi:NAD(P)-dependent dehydrogenase (short-subunit alcohol dehydrogenase family)